jgi:hypothetical protein
MFKNKLLIGIAITSVVAVAATLVTVQLLTGGGTQTSSPNPTTVPQVTVPPGQWEGGPVAQLEIPEGLEVTKVTHGSEVAEEHLTKLRVPRKVGEMFSIKLRRSLASGTPYALIEVDEISAPLSGHERDAAFDLTQMKDDPNRVVQRIVFRIRQIAGAGDTVNWTLLPSIAAHNLRDRPMVIVDTFGAGCTPVAAPFRDGAGRQGDTVRICLYAFGSMADPKSQLSSLRFETALDLKSGELIVEAPGDSFSHSQEHTDGHDHDPPWYKVDPVTGLPVVDENGNVVPAD